MGVESPSERGKGFDIPMPVKDKLRSYTFKEVEESLKDNSFLTVIRGNVYDLTQFYQKHPGGDVIRLAAARDGTILFESYHPSHSVNKLSPYLVGTCDDSPIKARADDKFFTTVRSRVENYLAENKLERQLTWVSLLELVLTLAVAVVSYILSAKYKSVMGAFVLGLVYARLGFLMHMGNHAGAASRSFSWLNKIHGACMDLIGGSSNIWMFDHNVAHHTHPNELNKDNDCEIGNPMYRFHPHLPRHWWHKYQVITISLGMTMGLVKWVFQDVANALNGKVGAVRVRFTKAEVVQFTFFKITFFLLHFVIPYSYHGAWGTVFRNFFITLILGAEYMENIFISSHIQPETVPDTKQHWAVQQVDTTYNWGSASPFWNWFSGGLNHQIEHHLFPSLAYYHYSSISPIVQKTCEEFGIPYRNFKHLHQAWYSCFSYLHALGNDNKYKPNKKKA
eukprot:TRINITY_DN274_c0_g1_i1.p1 TRINITY_DN274_c0_g1~~TRINITY_DN274_c0_g1_i1.p1  ORF type:complete len:460 (-),score=141.01 TRINITY_DN274_c0_g1_i1:100-1449(-)